MSLNNIQLQDVVVTELYKDLLLESSYTSPAPAVARQAAPAETTPVTATPIQTAPVTTAPIRPAGTTPATTTQVTTAPVRTPPSTTTPLATSPASATSPATQPSPAKEPSSGTSGQQTAAGYKVLGNNRRKVTIIVNAPGVPFLPDDQLNVLTRMLEACKMNMGDVAIVNHAAAPIVIGQLKQQLQPSFVLLFGPTPPEIGLPMDFPQFKIQAYDKCTYLTAPLLADMVTPGEESRSLKTRLWTQLKTLFEI